MKDQKLTDDIELLHNPLILQSVDVFVWPHAEFTVNLKYYFAIIMRNRPGSKILLGSHRINLINVPRSLQVFMQINLNKKNIDTEEILIILKKYFFSENKFHINKLDFIVSF